MKKLVDKFDTPYQDFALLVVLTDIKKTVQTSLVELREGGIIIIDALWKVLMEPAVYLCAVALVLLFGYTTFLATADDEWY